MSAIDQLFRNLRSQGRKAFIPFITAGDPDLAFTAAALRELAARGASLCEVGIPYSDPIADGPVIQASYTRALAHKIKVHDILEMARGVHREIDCPLATMVSYAIVYRHGLAAFVEDAKAAGFAGAIVPDLLVEECGPLREICLQEDFNLIQLVTPTTPRERALRIAKASTGFLYYVSVTGITGERRELPPQLLENVGWLREQTELPICIGFGVSQPEHVAQLAAVADGVIVGSALVRRLADAARKPRHEVLADAGDYVETLIGALESTR
jgi:tryptophan synthase alpha chain